MDARKCIRMTDAERIQLANQFTADWLEPDDADPADLRGYPRLACERVLFTMALVALIEQVEARTRETPSSGPLVDIDRVVAMCVMGDGTT